MASFFRSYPSTLDTGLRHNRLSICVNGKLFECPTNRVLWNIRFLDFMCNLVGFYKVNSGYRAISPFLIAQ